MKHSRWSRFIAILAALCCLVSVVLAGTDSGTLASVNDSVSTPTGAGLNLVSIDASGTWNGTIHLYQTIGTNGPRRQIPDTAIIAGDTEIAGAIPAGADGTYYALVAGQGTISIGVTAWTSGTAKIVIAVGPGAGSSVFSQQPVSPNPMTAALYDASGAGSTVSVEFDDSSGAPIVLTDSNGATYNAVTITISASSAVGLASAVLATAPDGTHTISALPTGVASIVLNCQTGSVTMNYAGTSDGSAGAGSGITVAAKAPGSATPRKYAALDWWSIGRTK